MSSIINSAPPPRPDIPDVHTLAAFAANQIIPDWTFLSAYRWYGSITGTPHILDAIAAICVTEQRPQPAAVALTIDNRLRQVRLLVTQGGVTEPDERLLSNMRKTWGLLRKHSEQAIKNRRQGLGQVHVTKPEQCLHRHIYLVKRVEVMRVIGEWWPKLDAADRQLGRSLRVSGEKVLESSPMSLFQHASLSLRKAVRMMGRDLSLVSPKSWQQVVSLMEIASGNCRAISDKWDDCEEWGPSFKGINGTLLCLSVCLLTITSRQRGMQTTSGPVCSRKPYLSPQTNLHAHHLRILALPQRYLLVQARSLVPYLPITSHRTPHKLEHHHSVNQHV